MIPKSNAPILILNNNTERETGRKAQLANIAAAKAIADIVTTTLGPRSMMKMLLDPMGGIVMTNDGHAILREIDTKHPAAKSVIELARMQDEEVGDGTTSVVCLTGEMMQAAKPFIERDIHPTIIVGAYFRALEDVTKILNEIAIPIDLNDDNDLRKSLTSCVGTKFADRWGTLIVDLALTACKVVLSGTNNPSKLNAEIKRYAKIEKIPGGSLEESRVVNGVMFNKDITHPSMRRYIKNPRVLLLDCPLEYKKAESQTNMEMSKDTDMSEALQQEINEIAQMCTYIMKYNPDVVITEKGLSDLAQHFLLKQNISCIRRIRKTDNNRVARVTGATIVSRPEEIQESDIGTMCHVFEIRKYGEEYFTFFEECDKPSACSILLRGGSKDSLNEMERNLHDALGVARNIFANPKLLPGGGATEMELSHRLNEIAKNITGLSQKPYKAVAFALEAIPRTLAQNCGGDVVRLLTELRAKHSKEQGLHFGIDGNKGTIADMQEINVWEPLLVKSQVIKTAIESSCMLLRIDDVVSGTKKKSDGQGAPRAPDAEEAAETFGDQRDG
jgi:T-complex protein 1 subunit gamma